MFKHNHQAHGLSKTVDKSTDDGKLIIIKGQRKTGIRTVLDATLGRAGRKETGRIMPYTVRIIKLGLLQNARTSTPLVVCYYRQGSLLEKDAPKGHIQRLSKDELDTRFEN